MALCTFFMWATCLRSSSYTIGENNARVRKKHLGGSPNMTLINWHIAEHALTNVLAIARLLHQHFLHTNVSSDSDGLFVPALDQGISDTP